MLKEVIVTTIEAVYCPVYGLITTQMCRQCEYFNGYRGFKKICCSRGEFAER